MPRFRDENDFVDREIYTPDRPVSSEAVWKPKTSQWLVNGPLTTGPALETVFPAQKANTGPSLKPEGPGTDYDDGSGDFVEIARPEPRGRGLEINKRSTRWPSTVWGTAARTDLKSSWKPVFSDPDVVVPCIERRTRREVLFARRRAGGAASRKRKRRNWVSNIHC